MKKIMVLILVLVVSGCQTLKDNPKGTMGTLLGAGLGGWAGSNVGGGKGKLIAVAIGVLGGAYLGRSIGQSLDKADKLYANRAANQALEKSPSNQSVSWRNPDSGNYGQVTPMRTYQTNAGQYCREYQTTITVGNEKQSGYGTACRQIDGSWQIKN